MNEVVGEKNCLDNSGGGRWLVNHFTKNEFYKCIGCILLGVTYGIKGHRIWGGIETSVLKKGQNPIHRDAIGKIDSIRVHCYIYRPH